HANVVTVFDCGSAAGLDYQVMELVQGRPLDELIPLWPADGARAVELGTQVARGLEAAHSIGVVHGGLTPGNIRVTPRGTLKILDFGASMTRATSPPVPLATNTMPHATLDDLAPERLQASAAERG